MTPQQGAANYDKDVAEAGAAARSAGLVITDLVRLVLSLVLRAGSSSGSQSRRIGRNG